MSIYGYEEECLLSKEYLVGRWKPRARNPGVEQVAAFLAHGGERVVMAFLW